VILLIMEIMDKLVVAGRFKNLDTIARFFAEAAQTAGLDERAIYAVQIAVDEACSNIIEHAYGGEGDDPIECSYQITDCGLVIILHDYGTPFDPNRIPNPALDTALEDRTVGGLGVYLIRQVMDQVRFESTADAGNILTMVKCR
jgi:serine/threonine-protein kinase RsbW